MMAKDGNDWFRYVLISQQSSSAFLNFFFLFSHQPLSYCYIIAYPDYYYLLLYFDQVIPDFRPIFMQDALSTIAPLL